MKPFKLFWDLKACSVFLMFFLVVSGCRSRISDQPILFNVTGFLTTEAELNSTIYLFVVPDTSFQTALDTVSAHLYVIQRPLIGQVNFSFPDLPPGDYLAMIPRNSFPGNLQGFPIAHEFNRSNFCLKVNFHGGNAKYSVLSFSIRPSLEGARTEK